MGDYAACIGTTGSDTVLIVVVNGVTVRIPPTGIFVRQKGIRVVDIPDGMSHTLLVGEKHVPNGKKLDPVYDCNMYDGHNTPCSTRSAGMGFPLAQSISDDRVVFGGRHPGICMFAFADGSVRPVRTSVDEFTLGLLSHRHDGLPVPADY